MKRDIFQHSAYEAYDDLLRGMHALLPLVIGGDDGSLTRRFVELHREAYARHGRPYVIAPEEAARTRARLAAFGVVDVVLPEVAADASWRFLLRSLAGLERVRELGGPVDLLRDDFLKGAYDLVAPPYEAPSEVGWARAADFVDDAVALAATTLDEVGIGDAINETPEAHAFFERYPDAYSYWDIHGYRPDEDPDLPDPLRYPGAIWSAAAIALAEPFAGLPCGRDGPATMQPVGVPPGAHLHPALVTACEAAARRGHALVGFVVVRP
jgi:hypothetical protein